jgi:hypothetical protein
VCTVCRLLFETDLSFTVVDNVARELVETPLPRSLFHAEELDKFVLWKLNVGRAQVRTAAAETMRMFRALAYAPDKLTVQKPVASCCATNPRCFVQAFILANRTDGQAPLFRYDYTDYCSAVETVMQLPLLPGNASKRNESRVADLLVALGAVPFTEYSRIMNSKVIGNSSTDRFWGAAFYDGFLETGSWRISSRESNDGDMRLNYTAYYESCAPEFCSYQGAPDFFHVVTTISSLYAGLVTTCTVLLPLFWLIWSPAKRTCGLKCCRGNRAFSPSTVV